MNQRRGNIGEVGFLLKELKASAQNQTLYLRYFNNQFYVCSSFDIFLNNLFDKFGSRSSRVQHYCLKGCRLIRAVFRNLEKQ